VSASEKLKAMHEAASAYITADDRGQQAIRDANHFVDTLVECAPQIIEVVRAAEDEASTGSEWCLEALAALEEALK